MWKTLFIALIFNSSAYALDLNQYIQLLKKNTLEILGMSKSDESNKVVSQKK